MIVRTVAEEKKVAELDNELKILVKRWEEAIAKVQQSKGVSLILEELGRTVGIIRDLFSPSFKHIHINDQSVYTEVRDYVELIAPERKDIVKLYKEEAPIYDSFGITKQIKSAFGKTVSFKIIPPRVLPAIGRVLAGVAQGTRRVTEIICTKNDTPPALSGRIGNPVYTHLLHTYIQCKFIITHIL